MSSRVTVSALALFAASAAAQTPFYKISDTHGAFEGELADGARFGSSIAEIGDLDGDGTTDLAVGAPFDGDGGPARGAIWILFRNPDGSTRDEQKISDTAGGFTGVLVDDERFGSVLAPVGDVDGDGVVDLAAGSKQEEDAVWILFLNPDGTVKGHSETFFPVKAMCELGDFDVDGTPDLAVGGGSVRVVFLNPDGTQKSAVGIFNGQGGFTGTITTSDDFAASLANVGDVDGDGNVDLAVGAPGDDHGCFQCIVQDFGAVWMLLLNGDGTVKANPRIEVQDFGAEQMFGTSVAGLGDVSGDGIPDVAVGALSGFTRVWQLDLNSDGTLKASSTIVGAGGLLLAQAPSSDGLAMAMARTSDLDGDGRSGLALGAPGDDDGGANRGAVWVLFDGDGGNVPPTLLPGEVIAQTRIGQGAGGFTGTLESQDQFGAGITAIGDLDGDGVTELAVGAHEYDGGGVDRGAVWILFLNADGTVKSHVLVGPGSGGFGGSIADHAHFGRSVAAIGDLDGDGVTELAVGAPQELGPLTPDDGAVWVLFLNADGTVKSEVRIAENEGGFDQALLSFSFFGRSVEALGDLDGDGVPDLAVGQHWDDDGEFDSGSVWLLFLNADGTVKGYQKISNTAGGFTGTIGDFDRFGSALANLGDFDGDGVTDLAVGAEGDDDGTGVSGVGAVWLLFLNPDGTVKGHQKISRIHGGFTGPITTNDLFGASLARLGDVDADGVEDLAVGAPGDGSGSVFVLFLNPDGTVASHRQVGDTEGNFVGAAGAEGLAALGDFNGDGRPDLAIGDAFEWDGVQSLGQVELCWLEGRVAPQANAYGCGFNPPDSLVVVSGAPTLGSTVTLGIDNPVGSQSPGSLPVLVLSTKPSPAFPCGSVLPGFGMSGPGELLIDLDPIGAVQLFFAGLPWAGPGTPAPFPLVVPDDGKLLGKAVYAQGILVDPTSVSGVVFGLTNGLELRPGSP